MNTEVSGPAPPEAEARARRAKGIIIGVAFVLMVLPMLLAWLTGAIRF